MNLKISNFLTGSKEEENLEISNPQEFKQLVHVDKDLNWSFDESVDSKSVFQKVRMIGKGGFGTVLELLHIPSGTNLAGKLISEDLMNRATRESLKKEIDLMRQIVTPYTIRYYGSVLFDESMTILMEFCRCGSLRDLIDSTQQPLNEPQLKVVMHDLLFALQMLHLKYKIVHRDIKAGNILLAKSGNLKVADFGVSRQFDQAKTYSTCSIVGTPYWMAPEVINGMKYSFPADIWSVGATAIELYEGAPPFSEFPIMRAMVLIATQGFQGFRQKSNPSPEFQDFVRKCMVIDPNLRATVPELLGHPFLKGCEDIDRQAVFHDLLEHEINYIEEKEDEEEEAPEKKYSSFVVNVEGDAKPEKVYKSIVAEDEYEEEEEEEDAADDEAMFGKLNFETISATKSPIKSGNETIMKVNSPIQQATISKEKPKQANPEQAAVKNPPTITTVKNPPPPTTTATTTPATAAVNNKPTPTTTKSPTTTNKDNNSNNNKAANSAVSCKESVKIVRGDSKIQKVKIPKDPMHIAALVLVAIFLFLTMGKIGFTALAGLIALLVYSINFRM